MHKEAPVLYISKSPLYHLILLATIRHYWLFVTFVTFSILVIKKSTREASSFPEVLGIYRVNPSDPSDPT